mgnify:FL=1
MSAVVDALSRGGPRFSLEVVPPSRGADPSSVLKAVESLLPYEPAFVSVTDHPGGRLWVDYGNAARPVPARAKPGTLGLCVAIREASGVPVVPHAVCIGNDAFVAEDALIDYRYAGFKDVFLVRGDERFAPYAGAAKPEGLGRAIELVRLAAALNRGEYAGGAARGCQAGLALGVACYPEKHPAAPNRERDLAAFKEKVDAGASWSLTQMVFDPGVYADFLARARAAGVEIPVLPGVKPVTSLRSLLALPAHFFITIPEGFIREMEEARTPAEERLVGIRRAEALCRGLYDAGAPCLHFFSMGRSRDTLETLVALFGPRAPAAEAGRL